MSAYLDCADESGVETRILAGRQARMAMAAARPRSADADLRRAAVCLRCLSAAFSHPVIRGLGVVVVDGDRSEVSRAFVEQVAASPNLGIVERTGDLASAARAIRAGDAIAAIYIPANFERDLKAERRPQVRRLL